MNYSYLFLGIGFAVLGLIFYLIKRGFENKQKNTPHVNPFIKTETEEKKKMRDYDYFPFILTFYAFNVYFCCLGFTFILAGVLGM